MAKEDKKLEGKRILISGKGGSGKSTFTTLMSKVLQGKGYKILALDGDASNPQGLVGLMFGLKKEKDFPKALIDFFGGIKRVTCPVDDPSPLTRLNDSVPIQEKKINIQKEIPAKYFVEKKGIILFQAGKIKEYGQGCDGPVEKVVRDFMVGGNYVNLVDTKAGIEHFGRKISENMDMVLLVVDPTLESISIAERIDDFCQGIGMKSFRIVLNKIRSKEIESQIINKLGKLKNKVIGAIRCDSEITESALEGNFLSKSEAISDVKKIIERIENNKSLNN